MDHFEARLMVLYQKGRLKSTQAGNLVKLFWSEESKIVSLMFENLDGFSLVWVRVRVFTSDLNPNIIFLL